MSSQLSDKVAIVTGASSGLGLAIATMFASRGACVTLGGRDATRLASALDTVIQSSNGHEERFLTLQGDINQQNVREKIVKKTVEKFGRLDILVANAGVVLPNDGIRKATEEVYDTTMDTNVKSVFFLVQQAVPHLEKSKGNIVTISSVNSLCATSPRCLYSVSKAALDHLTRCLALDLGPQGVRVNSVNPSFMPATRILQHHIGSDEATLQAEAERVRQVEAANQPLEGRCGTEEEVAEAVTFLASSAASFITGENLKVEGGRSFMSMCSRPRPAKV